MFRGQQETDLNVKNFGAGSFMKDGGNLYGVFAAKSIGGESGTHVFLIDLKTFKVVGEWVPCVDANFLTEAEARKLTAFSGATFSDFELLPGGLKAYDPLHPQRQSWSGNGVGINKF